MASAATRASLARRAETTAGPGRQRDDEQRRQTAEQPRSRRMARCAAAARCSASRRSRSTASVPGDDEGALEVGDEVGVRGDGVRGGLQAGAPPQRGRVAVVGVPAGGRRGEPPQHLLGAGVLGQPAAQPRPLPEQRLVGDLDRALAAVHSRAPHQGVDDLVDVRAAQGAQLLDRDPATGGGLALAGPASRVSTTRAVSRPGSSSPSQARSARRATAPDRAPAAT